MSISKFAPGSVEEALAQLLAGLSPHTQSSSPGSREEAFAQLLARLKPPPEPDILRLPVVLRKRGNRGRSTHYQDIKDGLFTEPVSIGARAVGWPASEVEAINAARIAGKSDDEIRELVQQLHAARKEAL